MAFNKALYGKTFKLSEYQYLKHLFNISKRFLMFVSFVLAKNVVNSSSKYLHK